MDNFKIVLHDHYMHHLPGEVESKRGHESEMPEDADGIKSHEIEVKLKELAAKSDAVVTANTERFAVGRNVHHYDFGSDSTITNTLTIVFGSGGVLLTYFAAIKPLINQWLKNRSSRSIKITIDGQTIELTGLKNFDEGIALIEKLQKKFRQGDKGKKSKKKKEKD